MNIQALIFDLDGTAMLAKEDGMPSKRVIDTVQKAKQYCHVSVATGRPLEMTENILKVLTIEDLCILNGGASLYSCKSKEYVWSQKMDKEDLSEVMFAVKQQFAGYFIEDEVMNGKIKVAQYKPQASVSLACVFALGAGQAAALCMLVSQFKGFAAHSMRSWTPGLLDVHITHELATKKHAMQALLAHLNVDHKKVMVVGDGGNDLPLFELAGIKVAMGNAEDVLKEKADWVAPTVDEDGLAVAIEKYINNSK